MKTKRFLLAVLAAMVAPTFAATAQTAQAWKPVVVGKMLPSDNSPHVYTPVTANRILASKRYVLAGNDADEATLFDLQTGKAVAWSGGLVEGGGEAWSVDDSLDPHLVLRGGQSAGARYEMGDEVTLSPGNSTLDVAHVSERNGKLELIFYQDYVRWDKASRRIERTFRFADPKVGCDVYSVSAVTRGGQTIVNAGVKQITFASTQTGKIERRVRLQNQSYSLTTNPTVSRFGAYAIYIAGSSLTGQNSQVKVKYDVVDTQTGRALWKFDIVGKFRVEYNPAVSPDEKWVAIPQETRKIWELRDLKTGAMIRTLPHLPNAQAAAFSPDGATLYSVANGTLYRQRAR